ncbi:DMT family transporter [Ramlibacter sp. H39-3-26]|uniref:DMT family transporter n=1 Tax=Curvibacter soli TaxID=3031331 RepID=UPI0023DB8ECD|nr:DMT family transporter [Ramlibacter sp. H39-3-26]MDF1486253.1 DMT family transporter [Ramlibacter sp. H39-3-26]
MRTADCTRLLLLAAIWGASFLLMRVVAPAIGAVPTAFLRVAFATAGLAAILCALRTRWDFRSRFGTTLALGVVNSGLPFLMYALAARLLPAGYSAIFNATTPLMGVLIGALFFGEPATWRQGAGVALGIAGVVLLTAVGPVALTPAVAAGAAACLVATACYGVAGFLARRWITDRGGLDARLVAFGSQAGAALVLAPFFATSLATSAAPAGGTAWHAAAPAVWGALAALGLVCTAWAYILYFRLIADIGPVRTLSVTFLIPPFGVLWGALLLGEPLSWAHAAGGGLIALAVGLVLGAPKAAAPVHPRGA